MDKLTFYLCDCQTTVSRAVRDFHARKIGVPPEAMPVIYNGVPELNQLDKEQIGKLREEWGWSACTKVIGSVGRLDWQKGYDQFLKFLPEISKKIPENENWGIVILGEGKQRSELEEIINRYKADNIKVVLPGFRKDAADCIGAFDLFVMPSRYEGFGLTLVEAMGHGVPVLASNADSLPELMSHYDNGRCINFTDEQEVLKEILDFIEKPAVEPLKRFSVDRMVDEYVELYNKLTLASHRC